MATTPETSNECQKFLRYSLSVGIQPPVALDDAYDLLNSISDPDLRTVCGSQDAKLRQKLQDELNCLEEIPDAGPWVLNLFGEQVEGWEPHVPVEVKVTNSGVGAGGPGPAFEPTAFPDESEDYESIEDVEFDVLGSDLD